MDVFATYWQHLTRIVGWDDAGIYGGRVGDMEKMVIVAISHFLSTNHVTYLFIWRILKFFPVISVENALCLKTVRVINTSA